jgi:hypothetical protein
MELTLPPEYRECFKGPGNYYPYEIRATPPGKQDSYDEAMCFVSNSAGEFIVEYWPKGSDQWKIYAAVPTLEEAINICKVLVLMGETTFLGEE